MMNPTAFNALLNRMADEPFEYGTNDCFTFTQNLLEAFHGVKLGQSINFKYHDDKTAKALIRRKGGYHMLITSELDSTPVPPSECLPGDVVIKVFANDKAPCLGFVLPKHVAVFLTESRAVRIPLSQCTLGWRIK